MELYKAHASDKGTENLLDEVLRKNYCTINIKGFYVAGVFIKDRYSLSSLLEDLSKVLTFNAVITGWELVKRSFVLDWFFNIGEFLASMVVDIKM